MTSVRVDRACGKTGTRVSARQCFFATIVLAFSRDGGWSRALDPVFQFARVLSAIRPLPCSLRCARERAPVAATRAKQPRARIRAPSAPPAADDPRLLPRKGLRTALHPRASDSRVFRRQRREFYCGRRAFRLVSLKTVPFNLVRETRKGQRKWQAHLPPTWVLGGIFLPSRDVSSLSTNLPHWRNRVGIQSQSYSHGRRSDPPRGEADIT